ncbi:MAG: DUF4118 domain-containing protein, partial [Erysipelotrichaceae bacterium]
TDEHVIVCLSSAPSNAKIIRAASRMAKAFNSGFTALFVETSDYSNMSEDNRLRLRENIHLAQQLGATIETAYGDDVAYQIAEFAKLSKVSKIILGRSNIKLKTFLAKQSLTEKLIALAPDLDIYIIPENQIENNYKATKNIKKDPIRLRDIVASILILLAASLLGYLFFNLGFSESNIITVYILSVLVTAIVTSSSIYSVISSFLSVIIFNFFFIEPILSLKAYDSGYPVTFLIMFIAAILTGSLASKIKLQAKQSAQTAYRTKILLETNMLLQEQKETNDIISVTSKQLLKLFNRNIVFYPIKDEILQEPIVFTTIEDKEMADNLICSNERAVAHWVFKNKKHAGATTNTLGSSKCLYLAVRASDKVYGVVGISVDTKALETFENNIMLSILGECALALEKDNASKQREAAATLAKNEQLRANLLRSISHDLRTPLTSISGNANVLIRSEAKLTKDNRFQLYSDIYDDSMWLINIVENLLSVTKIEDGTMHLKLIPELIDEIIEEAISHINRRSLKHTIKVINNNSIIVCKMDAHLIVQVIINIVDNAIKYTPEGSTILINYEKQGKYVKVSISDNGVGLSKEDKLRIFDMFYTPKNTVIDGRRSLGLGLALCKSIVNAHGGQILVKDNEPKGSIFSFTLPYEEVKNYE